MQNMKPYKISPTDIKIQSIVKLVRDSFAYMDERIDPPSSVHKIDVDSVAVSCKIGEVWAIGQPILGCVFLSVKTNGLYIGKLAVADSARKHGYGRMLIELAENRAKELNLHVLLLETRVELLENHETFSRLGFIKTGEGTHEGFERPTYIKMRKNLEV